MADLSKGKGYGTAVYPVHAEETSGLLRRAEPMLTPEMLKRRFLKGIPLTFPNGDTFTDEDLKDKIMVAMNETEVLLNRTITREFFKEKHQFDRSLYRAYIHVKAEHGPIVSIEEFAIVSADGNNVFTLPPTWIETSNFSKNQINLIPILAAYGMNQVTGSDPGNAGVAFLAMIDGLNWVPAYWQIKYTAGMTTKEGQVPVIVNELIGTIAAIDVLSEIAPSNIHNSQSLSQDGISQSSSGPGPRLYDKRIQDLTDKRDELVKKLKGIFYSKLWVSNI